MARSLLSVVLLLSFWLRIGVEGEDALPVTRAISNMRCKQYIPFAPSADTERVGEQASEIAVRRGTLARVCVRPGFWGAYSRLLASSAWPALLRLHPVLRHPHRSKDCTAYTCLQRIRTTKSNIHTRCLVWIEPLMSWASVPPQGTLLLSLFCTCACFISVYCLCE
jgi:hypothetical protein